MRSFLSFALLALPFAARVACTESASEPQESKPLYANAHEAFQDLLNALPAESLNAALQGMDRFKPGVFESDRHGVERVHNEDPPLATKLIVAAVQDLRKRQNGNVSVPATPSQQQSSEAPKSSQAPPAVIPVAVTTTDSNGRTAVVSSAFYSQPTASVAQVVTRTNAQGKTEVATTTKPAVIVTSTDAAGNTHVMTSAVDLAPTAGQVITTTDAKGSTFLTTYTPDGGSVRSVVLLTTTGTDGKPSVITSFTYVAPAAATQTGESGPSGTSPGKPGLQSGAANKNKAMEAAMVGGAIGGAFAFFV